MAKIPLHLMRYIVSELSSYKSYKVKAQEIREQIIYAGDRAFSGMPINHAGASVTENKAIALASHKELTDLSYRIRGIESVLQQADSESRMIIILRYIEGGMTHNQIMDKLGIYNRNRYFEKRDKIIEKLVNFYGFDTFRA